MYLTEKEDKYAGLWIRALALLIDCTIVLYPIMLSFVFLVLLSNLLNTTLPIFSPNLKPLFLLVIYVLILPTYFVVSNTSKYQGTFGKRICNIFIGKSVDKSCITFLPALGRYLFLGLLFIGANSIEFVHKHFPGTQIWVYLYLFFIAIILSNALVAITSQKTALHDIIFRTRVFINLSTVGDSCEKETKSHHILFTILLILWGAFFQLFNIKTAIIIWCFSLLYLVLVMFALVYYKYTNINIYDKYSPINAIKKVKLFFIALIPSFVTLVLVYGVVFYVKLKY